MDSVPLASLCLILAIPVNTQFQRLPPNSFPNSIEPFAQTNQNTYENQQGGQPQDPPPFDINKDFGPFLVANETVEAIYAVVSPFASDATLVVRIATVGAISIFDAIAPYTPTAIGFHSNLGRRPADERTIRNKNIAMFYCSLRVLANAVPDEAYRFVKLLKQVGLDPEDTHESTTDPIGIGNSCGRAINEDRDNDGMNSKGDIGAKSQYNHKPFNDYTGYKPINDYDKLFDPRRWQPAVVDQNGVFKIQKYVTPQHGKTRPYSYEDVNQFQAKPHGRLLEGPNGQELYKKTTDEVLAISAALTDEQKLAAEFFDDKFRSIGYTSEEQVAAAEARNLTYDEFVFYETVSNIAAFDTSIAIWKEKSRWDSVRPFSAIRYLYGDSPITSYCGKGKGTCSDLPASDWASYMPVADHPEYPSASAAICAAIAEASRNWFSDDRTFFEPFTFVKGLSRREFGLTPRQNTSLNFATWTDFELTCGSSRLWGGVHFVDAVEEGNRIGNEIGKLAADVVRSHVYPDSAAENKNVFS